VSLDELGRAGHVEVTGDRQDRVAGGVVAVEELGRVGHGGRLEIVEGTVAVVGVGERVEHDRRQLEPGEPTVRPVQHVDPDLLLDHVDLVAQVLLGQPRAAHAVGLEEERPLERVARQRSRSSRCSRGGSTR
jgi:hypothetical protein